MRLRSFIASTGPLVLALAGCTSDLPAPHDFEVVEPPPPANELQLDCGGIPLAANSADFDFTPEVMGLLEGVKYVYSAEGLPEGLVIDSDDGRITGNVTDDSGQYAFSILVEDSADPENYSARTECTLTVNPKISAPLALDTVPFCLSPGDNLRDLVVPGTGDGTEISCDFTGGNGNGRMPAGVEVDDCTVTGAIAEDRYGTWVFAMRGVQSGAEVFVPYCVTNDEAQGYEITADHSGSTDVALRPIMRTYDPAAAFTVGADGDPRYSVVQPGACGASCFYRYSFQRTLAPFDGNSFTLEPDGLIQDDMNAPIGFFHELRMSGGPSDVVGFEDRPWVLSVAVSYCLTDTDGGCDDPAADGDGAVEFAVVMVPDAG